MRKNIRKITVFLLLVVMLLSNFETTFAAKEDIVVVLDAGHDATHGGTVAGGTGYAEADLNLKIARYCKEELEKYEGVKVYMVRNDSKCPFPNTSAEECNNGRVAYAQSVGADYYVSFHLNSFSDPAVNGALVLHPNENYRPDLGDKGKKLAGYILNELKALGLKDMGIKSSTATKAQYDFPDGSKGDTYRVIREGKKAGYASVIIEHAFLSCPTDREKFLSTEEKLKALGVADATGIAKFLGLTGDGNGGHYVSGPSSSGGGNTSGNTGNQGSGNTNSSTGSKPSSKLPLLAIPVKHPEIRFYVGQPWNAPTMHHNLRSRIQLLHTQKPVLY